MSSDENLVLLFYGAAALAVIYKQDKLKVVFGGRSTVLEGTAAFLRLMQS